MTALVDMIMVMSACPMDVTPVNGGDGTPQDVEWEVLAASSGG